MTSLSAALSLAVRLPIREFLPYWFWKPTTRALPEGLLIAPALALALGAVVLVRRSRLRTWLVLLLLILIGTALQHAFALMEGRGIDGLRDRMLHTGHARFALEAASQDDMLRVARNYQQLIETGHLYRYPTGTKPPGQLLFYMATERAARLLAGSEKDPMVRAATFASILWPFLSYLVLIPLYFLGRLCLEERQAFTPCLLYLGLPSVTLVTLHLDQCLYPLLFLMAVALLLYGLRLRRGGLLFLAGVTSGLALFVSFSLVVLLPFSLLLVLLEAVPRFCLSATTSWTAPTRIWAGAGRRVIWFLSGFVATELAFRLLLNYNVMANYRFAMSIHQTFKIKEWTAGLFFYAGLLNLVEFALWSGAAVSVLAVIHLARSIRGRSALGVSGSLEPEPMYPLNGTPSLERHNGQVGRLIGMAFVPLLLGMAFLGRTLSETARLWLFLAPLLALFAGGEAQRLFRARPWAGTTVVLVLQLLSVFALKAWQDFY